MLLGAGGLFLVYFFQNYLDFYSVFVQFKAPQPLNYTSDFVPVESGPFIVNKVGRYILNDLFAMSLVYGLFYNRKYLRFAFWVLLFGLVVLVPAYLSLYLLAPAGFSSMLTHLHRLVMNPVLMMLLIPAFFYQQQLLKQTQKKEA
jgi:exosortase F-associated protein